MVQRRSWLRAHACEINHATGFWVMAATSQHCPTARSLRRSRLNLFVALALNPIGLLAAPLALSVLSLPVLGLTILGLTILGLPVLGLAVPAAAFLARREIG